MERNTSSKTNSCDMSNIRPAMASLPYPPIQVRCKNQEYADLLSVDYCGQVSELSAITQYINNENRTFCQDCSFARVILGIAMAEMMHLQKLGELISLLGGDVDYMARQPGGRGKMWSPSCLNIPKNIKRMICADIEAEKAAIHQYRMHIDRISDECVNAVLERIIIDEEYHIMLLEALMKEQ